MAWYDTKQAAVDPDNPAANEQIPFSEWNAMVTYLKDKIIDKAVNDAAIANNRVLVYKTATSTFVFEDQSAVAAINDLTDVVISGVPANNEVLAYNTATSKWINQTAAEAALATTTDLASYYPLSGGTLTGNLNMGDYLIDDVDDIQAYDASGILFRNYLAASLLHVGYGGFAFYAHTNASMNSNKIEYVTDPTSAQDAATKNYCDTRVATKELVTNFTNDYVLIYKTASGKFEMEEQSAALGLPVVDTTAIIKGSADGTKQIRFEVDGLTSSTTRVLTVPNKNFTICGTDEVMLLNGSQGMSGTLMMGDYWITGITQLSPSGTTITVDGILDVNSHVIKDMKNSAASALSGTQKDIEIDIGGTPYYFTVYPTKA
jgi:hypothetical protein